MNEDPIIKKKNGESVDYEDIVIKKKTNFFKEKVVPNLKYILPIIFVVFLLIIGTVSLFFKKEEIKENELVFQDDKMQVVLKSDSATYTLTGNNLIKENSQDYRFTVVNTGNTDINYYEIRVVNQEDRVSTLPYKYLKYSLNDNAENYLSDNNGVIYSGEKLLVNESQNFDLKIWLDEDSVDYYDKSLYLAMEVTLYNDYPDIYVNYELNNHKLKTTIYEPITSYIPEEEGHVFIGWGIGNQVLYRTGDIYKDEKGMTLYPIYQEKVETMN